MSILHHHNHLSGRNHRLAATTTATGHHKRFPSRTLCTVTTPMKPSLPTKPLTIIVPTQPPLAESTISKAPHSNDPSLRSTWTHRAWVVTGCGTVLLSSVKSIMLATTADTWVEPIVAGMIGYLLADLGSGVYHWGIDNYGDASTPIFGGQIEAFQGHHKWPWTITRRQFANNLHALARVIALTVIPFDVTCHDPTVLGFVSMFSGCIMFSQQFHAWAHSTKSKLPAVVVALQDSGVLVSRSQHGDHHRTPYNNNYCIVSGAWNKILDENKVFEVLEMVLFFKFGVRPRSWSEPSLDWTEDI